MNNLMKSHILAAGAFAALCSVLATAVRADEPEPNTLTEDWAIHGQTTVVEQYHPVFHSPYEGANSLAAGNRGNETVDMTLFLGVRLWKGGEAYANPEIDQGFGLSNTIGVAGFPSGEAYKVGKSQPYFRLQRVFFRQTFNLGGEVENISSDANQLGGTQTSNNLVITFGKFSVTDIFDTNSYAHDPRGDFLNWSIIDAGAFDYAADAWGYSYGIAAELTYSWWTLRAGLFNLSSVPNSTALERDFSQYELVLEAEERHTLWDQQGKLKLLGFLNRGYMGSYDDALYLAQATGNPPDVGHVRRYASRPGVALNLEQALADDLGLFARISLNDGSEEAYEFTEINRSLSSGLSLKGSKWGRPDDTLGIAYVMNALSASARSYFAAGGMGILIGDGQLPHYGTERIVETYYNAQLTSWLTAGADYQLLTNPAYNRDRGPVSVLGARLHVQF